MVVGGSEHDHDHHRSSCRLLVSTPRLVVRKCEVTLFLLVGGQRSIRQADDGDASSARPLKAPSLTGLLHTAHTYIALLVLLHACTIVPPSALIPHTLTPTALTTQPEEPSRSLATRSAALINSIIALFNCTAPFSGTTLETTQDDSDRVRGPHSPGHPLPAINRAGLARLADRLSQSRSQRKRPITAHHTDTPVYPYLSRLRSQLPRPRCYPLPTVTRISPQPC